MAIIRITNRNNREISTNPAISLLSLFLREGVEIPNRCGGHARCGWCRVTFISGLEKSSPRTPHEARFAREANLPENVRLACQTRLAGDAVIMIGQKRGKDGI